MLGTHDGIVIVAASSEEPRVQSPIFANPGLLNV